MLLFVINDNSVVAEFSSEFFKTFKTSLKFPFKNWSLFISKFKRKIKLVKKCLNTCLCLQTNNMALRLSLATYFPWWRHIFKLDVIV